MMCRTASCDQSAAGEYLTVMIRELSNVEPDWAACITLRHLASLESEALEIDFAPPSFQIGGTFRMGGKRQPVHFGIPALR